MYMDLPLHWGHCPAWLFEKMVKVAEKFLILFVKEQWTEKLLDNLADPLWFQSLWCYLWFDWHSSGLTTVVWWVLSTALKNINYEIWIYCAGGKWKTAISTPKTLENLAYKFNFSFYRRLQNRSRFLAKVDNTLIQDWFNLYFHMIFFNKNWKYTIIQQGKFEENNYNFKWLLKKKWNWARRYHRWNDHWEKMIKVLENNMILPIDFKVSSSVRLPKVLNLASEKSWNIRKNIVELVDYISKSYKMPDHHLIGLNDFDYKKLVKTLSLIKTEITSFKDLIGIKGIWPKSIFNLVQTAELIYWVKADWTDPARFSFTHGGKDGTPYKPIREEFDDTIKNLKVMIDKAKKEATLKKIYFKSRWNLFS